MTEVFRVRTEIDTKNLTDNEILRLILKMIVEMGEEALEKMTAIEKRLTATENTLRRINDIGDRYERQRSELARRPN